MLCRGSYNKGRGILIQQTIYDPTGEHNAVTYDKKNGSNNQDPKPQISPKNKSSSFNSMFDSFVLNSFDDPLQSNQNDEILSNVIRFPEPNLDGPLMTDFHSKNITFYYQDGL